MYRHISITILLFIINSQIIPLYLTLSAYILIKMILLQLCFNVTTFFYKKGIKHSIYLIFRNCMLSPVNDKKIYPLSPWQGKTDYINNYFFYSQFLLKSNPPNVFPILSTTAPLYLSCNNYHFILIFITFSNSL